MEYSRSSSPKKRRLSDFQEDYSSLIRSPDVWFEDGDVTIQAENVQFRVRSDSFSEWQCAGFYKMFIAGRTFELDHRGTPLSVIYVPEKAQEWRDLLMHYYRIYKDWYSMDRTISLMRLSQKYEFTLQKDSMTNRLRTIVPCTDIWAWDSNDLSDLALAGQSMYISGWEFHMANCFEEVGMQTVLPALYFLIIRDVGLEKIMTGQPHPSGETVHLSAHTKRKLISAIPQLTHLSMNYTELTPRRLLQDAHRSGTVVCEVEAPVDAFTAGSGNTFESSCSARSEASDAWLLRLAREPGLALRRVRGESEIAARCEPCDDFIKPLIIKGRERIWEELPLIFGLPPWEEMSDYRDTLEDVGQLQD